jgi:hypothetical protein
MNIIHKENLKLPLQKHKTNQTGYKNQSFNKIQHNPEANTHKLSQNPQKVSIFACLNKKEIDANFEKKKATQATKIIPIKPFWKIRGGRREVRQWKEKVGKIDPFLWAIT